MVVNSDYFIPNSIECADCFYVGFRCSAIHLHVVLAMIEYGKST